MIGESGVGRALLIAFSDGVDTASWLTPEPVLQTAKRADVVAYAVSVGQRSQDFVRDMADATGGQVFENQSAEHLEKVFLAVLNEFRRRYVLMYTPAASDPGWHRARGSAQDAPRNHQSQTRLPGRSAGHRGKVVRPKRHVAGTGWARISETH